MYYSCSISNFEGVMKKHIPSIILMISCIGFWGVSGKAFSQTLSSDKPKGEVERSMQTNLNWNLQNALLLYYPETKFVVNTRVKVSKASVKRPLPRLPEALLSKDLKNLPGLPYIPDDLSKAPAEEAQATHLQESPDGNPYRLDRILVNVLVDRSLSDSDWSFIRRFVGMTANLDASRGDQVRIEAAEFPEKASFSAQPATPEKEKPVEAAEQLPADKSPLPFWLPYAFAAGLAVFLLILFFVGQRGLLKQLKQSPLPTAQTTATPAPAPEMATAPGKPVAEAETGRDVSALEVLKTSAIDAFVGSPAACAKVLNDWIDAGGEAAYAGMAVLFTSVSRSLVDLVQPYLGQERSEALHREMATLHDPDVPAQAREQVLKRFDEEIRRLALREKFDSREDALSFLQQMSDDQLQHLLKPLKTGVMAIVLAQLRSNRAAKILKMIEPEERRAVLAAMANIERIPADVYQHVARQLAARAQELKKMRYVRANGVDALVKVMDHLDEDTQNGTLEYLQTQNVELAKKVREQFMTFDELIRQPGERLRQAALAVDREVLAKSLVTLDEQVVENIINSLPEKLGELVRASLEVNHDISEKEVSSARRTLLRSARGKTGQKILT